MKNILLISIAIITLFSCSSDDNDAALSFNINSGDKVASSKITIINTSTNYFGNYIWEVTSDYGTQTYTTNNLSFYANRIGDYTIKLKSTTDNLETEQAITITRPSKMLFNKLTLKSIPHDYNSLYFKLNTLTTGGNTYIYTSQTRTQIISIFPELTEWNIDFPYNIIDVSNDAEFLVYQIEFYDNNDNLVTKLDAFSNIYSDGSEFVAGEEELRTSTISCSDCDYFEVLADFSFQL